MPSDNEPIRPDELEAIFGSFHAAKPCALAVSGGSDSVALMVMYADWLRQKQQDAGLHTVLSVDHGLRPESAREARAVAAQAAALGFRHATLAWEGSKPQTGIQAAARTARYRLMGDYMRSRAIALLFTAHTRDDQAETLLMRLARGSGLDGLAAMSPRLRFGDLGFPDPEDTEPEIARPLLDVPKARLRATLEARGIAWIEDPSNQSQAYERPRLRAARAHLDALGLTDAMLALSATRLLRARRALDQTVEFFCSPAAGAVSIDPCGYFTIDRARLQDIEEEIALRVLGRVIAAAGGSHAPVSLGKLETIAAAVRFGSARSEKWTLARAMITADGHTVTIEREPGRDPLPSLELEPGASARWDGRFWVQVAPGSAPLPTKVRPLGEVAWSDLRQQGVAATRAPSRAIAAVPSFWREGSLAAVPTLGYWVTPEARDAFQAKFIWIETFK